MAARMVMLFVLYTDLAGGSEAAAEHSSPREQARNLAWLRLFVTLQAPQVRGQCGADHGEQLAEGGKTISLKK